MSLSSFSSNSQVFIVLAVAVASAHAGIISTGASSQHRSEDGLGNYAFGYDEGHLSGGSFRRESGNALGVKVGSYGLRDADGRVRTVNYVADAAGFRASVSTNEPGTAPSLTGAASYNAPAVAAVPALAAAASYAAPVVAAPAYAARAYAAPLAHYGAPLAAPIAHYRAHLAAPVAHYGAHFAARLAYGHHALAAHAYY